MAFIPTTTFLPRFPNHGHQCKTTEQQTTLRNNVSRQNRAVTTATALRFADAMEFFRHREGKWSSSRISNNIVAHRSDRWESDITVECIDRTDDRVLTLCHEWNVDPGRAQGGCFITWRAESKNEKEITQGGTTVALIPDGDDKRHGKMLRDKGYAEKVPVAASYHMTDDDALVLETPYEGTSVYEQMAFPSAHVMNRVSSVKRFGKRSTSTFATELRCHSFMHCAIRQQDGFLDLMSELSSMGICTPEQHAELTGLVAPTTTVSSPCQAATPLPQEFVRPASSGVTVDDVNRAMADAAERSGIDLSKFPPVMREDFVNCIVEYGSKAAPLSESS